MARATILSSICQDVTSGDGRCPVCPAAPSPSSSPTSRAVPRSGNGTAQMAAAVERHLMLLRTAVSQHQGTVIKVVGDAVQAAFARAPAAVSAGLDAQWSLRAEQWPAEVGPLRVRMALHTGVAEPVAGDYLAPVNRLSRTLAAGHGGQILVTEAT